MAVTSPDGVQKILYEPLFPALSVGTVAGENTITNAPMTSLTHFYLGMGGFAVGGIAGIFTSAHPALFSTVAGFQCFFLGSSYYCKYSSDQKNPKIDRFETFEEPFSPQHPPNPPKSKNSQQVELLDH